MGEEQKKVEKSIMQIFKESGQKALGGGISGAVAMGVNVLTLMWMRTTINYQYRHGTTTTVALKTIYSQGGIRRFYSGLIPALIQVKYFYGRDPLVDSETLLPTQDRCISSTTQTAPRIYQFGLSPFSHPFVQAVSEQY